MNEWDAMTNAKPIPGFPRYVLTPSGDVYSLGCSKGIRATPRLKKPSFDKDGYRTVGLCIGKAGKTKTHRVARLVLETFVGPAPDGMQAAHQNGVNTDDRLENLAWKTSLANIHDKYAHGTMPIGEKCYRATITEDTARAIKHSSDGHAACGRRLGVPVHTVMNIRYGKCWRHV